MIDLNTIIGAPYRWGARGPDAYDCWGLVRHVCEHAGLPLPIDWSPKCRQDAHDIMREMTDDPQFERCDPKPWTITALGNANRVYHVGLQVPRGILHTTRRDGAVITPAAIMRLRGYTRIEHYRYCTWPAA